MNTEPKTTIPVPTSLTSTTPQLPPLTSTLLLSHLRSQNIVTDLQTHLSDSLARTGWTDRVRALALELLRNGTCETFPELFDEVLRRTKTSSTVGGSSSREGQNGTRSKEEVNGTSTPTNTQGSATGSIVVSKDWFGPDGLPDVKIPEKVVEGAAEWLKEKVEGVVEVVDDE